MGRAEPFPIGATITLDDLERDLHTVTARLRPTEPVSWLPCINGWFVTSRELAIAVMRDADTYTVDDPRFSTGQVVGPSMLSLDGVEHARHRAPFVDPYRPPNLEELAHWIENTADDLISTFVAEGTAELRSQLAAPLAAATIHRSLDLVDTTPEAMLGWYGDIVTAVSAVSAGHARANTAASAMRELRAAVANTVAANPESLVAKASGANLSSDEVAQNAAIVMFGAIETAEAMTSNALFHLLSNREQLELVQAERSLVANAVEESLRLEPAASVVDRYATVDTHMGSAEVSQSDLVRVSLAGANRDPDTFANAHQFDASRTNARKHVTFAHGPHACIGVHLARMETVIAVNSVLDRLPDISLGQPADAPTGLIFRKSPRLTATWA